MMIMDLLANPPKTKLKLGPKRYAKVVATASGQIVNQLADFKTLCGCEGCSDPQ
jgi:hypothetical protein